MPLRTPSVAFKGERESERFEVDNTPPVIEGLKAAEGTIRFSVHDSSTAIERAQYSVDGGEWMLLAPVGNVSDALEERYEIAMSGLSRGEHTIAVRAYDRFENVGSAKTTLTVPAAKP